MKYTDREFYEAQVRAAKWLRNHGLTINHAGPVSPFALCTPKMTRIGVRRSAYKQIEYGQDQKGWKICFGDNALTRDAAVDFYVLVLEVTDELKPFGIKRPMLLVLRAPLKRYSLAISLRDLMSGKWSTNFDNWQAIKSFDDAKS